MASQTKYLPKKSFTMSTVDIKLEESISDFFSNAGACTTRSSCDAFAIKTFGGPVTPVPSQGLCSYTVAAANGTVIVQFREPDSPLDTKMLATVQTVHPDFVSSCSFHGTIGSSPALLIYSMNMLPGENYFHISLSIPDDDLHHRLATVRSLSRFVRLYLSWSSALSDPLMTMTTSRFFGQSWQRSSRPDPDTVSASFAHCHSSFTYLCGNLPSRFQKTAIQVQDHLPAFFSGEYPLVVTHGDLSQMNMLANPETGEITGIIDWAEAGILPFGFALYVLDNILGYLTPSGWVFHDTAEHLQHEFWSVFCGLVGGFVPA
jgi:hypothetical protein